MSIFKSVLVKVVCPLFPSRLTLTPKTLSLLALCLANKAPLFPTILYPSPSPSSMILSSPPPSFLVNSVVSLKVSLLSAMMSTLSKSSFCSENSVFGPFLSNFESDLEEVINFLRVCSVSSGEALLCQKITSRFNVDALKCLKSGICSVNSILTPFLSLFAPKVEKVISFLHLCSEFL